LTAQGHPRAIFQRAIERGNLIVAEATLRALGHPTLVEVLELTILIAQRAPQRHGRVVARWLLRYLESDQEATIEQAQLVAACLASLAGRHHAEAAAALRDVAHAATGRRGPRGVA
jgi:hypothetical protein